MIRILIVDDEKPICDLIDLNLSSAGYHCTAVQDGLEAIDLIEKEAFDLVLLDIMLPGADGYDVMEYIRPLGIPVIFITAKYEVKNRVKGLKLGADDYLVKPFDVVELVARVEAVLRRYNKADAPDTSADYDIGDSVPFVLTGTVAENFDLFVDVPYKFIFHDTEDAGLTFNNDISVTVDGTAVDGSAYRVVLDPGEGETFQVIFDDLRQVSGVHAGSVIEITYSCTLNENAVIGSTGNKNTMHLEYSNNPYDSNETGNTPDKTVIVFTYKVEINKVDGENKPLAGAGFALYKLDTNYTGDDGLTNEDGTKNNVLGDKIYNKLVKMYNADAATTMFSFEGIDDGEYLLVETETPDGYNSIDPVAFKVTATHSGTQLTDLNGNPIEGTVELTFTSDAGTGAIATDVVNKSGSLLPSTGGIGTTMFYIIGGVLIVGACVVLFARKTMKNEKR